MPLDCGLPEDRGRAAVLLRWALDAHARFELPTCASDVERMPADVPSVAERSG